MLKVIAPSIAATVTLLALVSPANAFSLVTGTVDYRARGSSGNELIPFSNEFVFDSDSERKIGESFVYDLFEIGYNDSSVLFRQIASPVNGRVMLRNTNGDVTADTANSGVADPVFILSRSFGSTLANAGTFGDAGDVGFNPLRISSTFINRDGSGGSAVFSFLWNSTPNAGRADYDFSFIETRPDLINMIQTGGEDGDYIASAAVPEPTTMVGAGLAAGGFSLLRRKRQCRKSSSVK